jgi:hypothetical protein
MAIFYTLTGRIQTELQPFFNVHLFIFDNYLNLFIGFLRSCLILKNRFSTNFQPVCNDWLTEGCITLLLHILLTSIFYTLNKN